MINEFRYSQTWKIWSSPLSLSLYSTFKACNIPPLKENKKGYIYIYKKKIHTHKMPITRQRYQSIPTWDIDDQRTMQSELTGGTIGHTKQKMVVLDATFPRSPCKNI